MSKTLLDRITINPEVCHGKPARLFLIQTGNIKNRELFDLVRNNHEMIKKYAKDHRYMELHHEGVFGT